jgi:ribosome maturation factor RimP
MALKDQIAQLVTPSVEEAGYFLEDVHVVTPGNQRIVTCIVDGETALNLDQVTSASKIISGLLDEAAFMGETPFTLEVTSPGVDRPLTQPRHFAKNVDRLLKIIKLDGSEVTGRILSNTDKDVTLTVTVKKETLEQTVSLADIKRAVVEIEFNRKDDK